MTANRFSHLDAEGRAAMVDVGDKAVTHRTAEAEGRVVMAPETLALLKDGQLDKGDAFAAARIAGIQAAKRTDHLIPLCHSLPLSSVSIAFSVVAPDSVWIQAIARTDAKTGVEMEALTAVSVAALTFYDMTKSADKGLIIQDIRLVSKTGGKTGPYRAPDGRHGADDAER